MTVLIYFNLLWGLNIIPLFFKCFRDVMNVSHQGACLAQGGSNYKVPPPLSISFNSNLLKAFRRKFVAHSLPFSSKASEMEISKFSFVLLVCLILLKSFIPVAAVDHHDQVRKLRRYFFFLSFIYTLLYYA